jgi:ferredoxin--NADP+ reductase
MEECNIKLEVTYYWRHIMIQYKLKIINITEEAEGTRTYYLEKPEDFTWDEGAHTHIGLIGYDEGELPNKEWVRHMSIMTLPSENKIGITTRVPGSTSEFKKKLSELQAGDEVKLFKIGSRMSLKREDRPIILLSMGVGISTLRPIILAYNKDKAKVPSIINMNIDSSGKFIYKEELDLLANESYKNYWMAARQSFYEKLQEIMKTENAIYYIVGSDIFIKEVIQHLRSANVKDVDIIIDKKEVNFHLYFN